jgi:Zn-dependent protease
MKIEIEGSAILPLLVLTVALQFQMGWGMALLTSCLILLSLLVHEFGHWSIAMRHGVTVKKIGLSMLGGYTVRHYSNDRIAEIESALAGPVANLVLAMLLSSFAGEPWQFIAKINLIIGFSNLVPIPPSDGWKILKEIAMAFDVHKTHGVVPLR